MSVGIILTTYGEPERNSFAEQWVYSYRILRGLTRKIAPIPLPVLPIIATARAVGRVRMWREHQFASPLEALHRQTVEAVQGALARRGIGDGVVTWAYEFRKPDLADALRDLRGRGCERAIIVPMYIAEGDFTHGMTEWALGAALQREPWWAAPGRTRLCSMTASRAWEARLSEMLAAYCLESMRARGVPEPAAEWAIMLAAHGTVVTSPPHVDNGLLHFARVLRRVKQLLRPHVGLVRIGWLNHTRGGRWTTPPVNEALEIVQRRGFNKLVYFPWGFTTDNAETALEGRVALAEMERPFERVEYLECLNARDAFTGFLAERIGEELAATEPGVALSQAS